MTLFDISVLSGPSVVNSFFRHKKIPMQGNDFILHGGSANERMGKNDRGGRRRGLRSVEQRQKTGMIPDCPAGHAGADGQGR